VLQDEINNIVNDICYGQDSRIKFQEERDRKMVQNPHYREQFLRLQYRNTYDESRRVSREYTAGPREYTAAHSRGNGLGKTRDFTNSQSRERYQRNKHSVPKLPPINQESLMRTSSGISYLDLYNHRKKTLQTDLKNAAKVVRKYQQNQNKKQGKKNKEIRTNNDSILDNNRTPAVSRSEVKPKNTKKEKHKNLIEGKLPSIVNEESNLKQPKKDSLKSMNEEFIGQKLRIIQILQLEPEAEMEEIITSKEMASVHQEDKPTRIVMEENSNLASGILKKLPKVYQEHPEQSPQTLKKKKKSLVKFNFDPEIIDDT